jgi:hypothetical protein
LGLQSISEIRRFNVECFRERWGDTGTLLWRRLNGRERQVISPLLPSESLMDYVHLDFPASLLPFLMHCLEGSLKSLCQRLKGRGEFAQKLRLHLYCEYSDKYHLVEMAPASPCRDLSLFLKMMENKLHELNLENPIRQYELEIIPCSEKVHQLNFWEPQVRDQDKAQQLMSIFQQASITTGFLRPQASLMPEESWSLVAEAEEYEVVEDQLDLSELNGIEGFQIKPFYSQSVQHAPRPTRLLRSPKPLSDREVQRFQFLSSQPVERLEDSWWEHSRGRDYFVALSHKGECVWLYRDRIEDQFYLHGYFDSNS